MGNDLKYLGILHGISTRLVFFESSANACKDNKRESFSRQETDLYCLHAHTFSLCGNGDLEKKKRKKTTERKQKKKKKKKKKKP